MSKEYDLKPALKQFFERDEFDRPWIAFVRDFAKSSFDFLRNLLIVGGLKYLADKTGNAYAQDAYYFANFILLLLAYSYIGAWNIRVFQHLPWKKTGEILDITVSVLVSVLLVAITVQAVSVITDAIVESHAP